MEKQQITVLVNPDGSATVTVDCGAAGSEACHALTKPLEDALGIVTDTTATADAYRQPTEQLATVKR